MFTGFNRVKRIVALFIKNPKTLIPFIIRESIMYTVQAIIFLTAFAELTYLRSIGLLDAIASKVLEGSVGEAFYLLVRDPIFDAILSVGVAICILAYAILESFISSGLYPMVENMLVEGESSITYMFGRSFKGWKTVLPTVTLLLMIIYMPLALVLSLLLTTTIYAPESPALTVLAVSLAIIGCGAGVAYILTIFSTIVASIDWVDPLRAIKTSYNIVKSHFLETMFFILAQSVLLVLLSMSIQASYAFGGLALSITALIPLIAEPILLTYLVSVYEDFNSEETVEVEVSTVESVKMVFQVFTASLRALRESLNTRTFRLGVLLSIVMFVLGVFVGYSLINPTLREAILELGIVSPKRINPVFKSVNRVLLGVDISFHNWRTAIGTSFSGLALGLPPLGIVFINGFILGAFTAAIGDYTLALPIILPHGIVEITAFMLASASGIMIAWEFIRYLKGSSNLEKLSYTTILTAKLLIALLVLFIVAGLIEALITPVIAEFYGWT